MNFISPPTVVNDFFKTSQEDSKFTLVAPMVVDTSKYTGDSVIFPVNTGLYPNSAKWIEPDVPAGDPSASWISGTSYLLGDRVRYQRVIYQRAVAGAGTTTPDLDLVNWVKVSAVNAWKMFDNSNSTQTMHAAGTNLEVHWAVVCQPADFIDTVVLDNIVCDTITVLAYSSLGAQIYARTIDLRDNTAADWWDYFFKVRENQSSAVFQNLPRGVSMTVEFIASSVNGEVRIGTLALGRSIVIGDTQYGANLGIVDYSTKDADTFGNYTVVQRGSSKRMSLSVRIDSESLDYVAALLTKYRAIPAMWLGTGDLYNSMLMFGYYRNFDIVIPGFKTSLCNIDIEGLT